MPSFFLYSGQIGIIYSFILASTQHSGHKILVDGRIGDVHANKNRGGFVISWDNSVGQRNSTQRHQEFWKNKTKPFNGQLRWSNKKSQKLDFFFLGVTIQSINQSAALISPELVLLLLVVLENVLTLQRSRGLANKSRQNYPTVVPWITSSDKCNCPDQIRRSFFFFLPFSNIPNHQFSNQSITISLNSRNRNIVRIYFVKPLDRSHKGHS